MYSFLMWTHVFISFVYMARIIAGSYDKSMFKLFGKLPNCFSEQLYHFKSIQQCVRIPVSPHPYQQLLFFDFNHHNRCEVVSYYAFNMYTLMTNDIEYLFICFLATCMQSQEKCIYTSLPIFNNQVIIFIITLLFLKLFLSYFLSDCLSVIQGLQYTSLFITI